MRTATRSVISSLLVGVALAGCDAPSDRAAAPSGIERTNPNALSPAQALAEALADPDAYARARRLGALLPKLGPILRLIWSARSGEVYPDYKRTVRRWS